MSDDFRFQGTLEPRGRGGHVVELPEDFDPKERFGKVRAPVVVTIHGHTFRTTLMRYGSSDYIGLSAEVRAAAGVDDGMRFGIKVVSDDQPRAVMVPRELEALLDSERALRAAFDALSLSNRREYAVWISSAKRADTRQTRLKKTSAMLRAGIKHP